VVVAPSPSPLFWHSCSKCGLRLPLQLRLGTQRSSSRTPRSPAPASCAGGRSPQGPFHHPIPPPHHSSAELPTNPPWPHSHHPAPLPHACNSSTPHSHSHSPLLLNTTSQASLDCALALRQSSWRGWLWLLGVRERQRERAMAMAAAPSLPDYHGLRATSSGTAPQLYRCSGLLHDFHVDDVWF
jgi:hypothetical protein